MKVLLFANDFQSFTDGSAGKLPGRGRQLEGLLERAGMLTQRALPASGSQAQTSDFAWEMDRQSEVIAAARPDAIIYCGGWEHVYLAQKPAPLLIVDLDGSCAQDGGGSCRHVNRLLSALAIADCVLISEEARSNFVYGWLVQAGRVPQGRGMLRCVPRGTAEEEGAALLDFWKDLMRAEVSRPATGEVYPKPEPITCEGERISLSVRKGEALEQRFVVPEEHTASIEIPCRPCTAGSGRNGGVSVVLRRAAGGRVLSATRCSLAQLAESRRIVAPLPQLFGPRGGDELSVSIRVESDQDTDGPLVEFTAAKTARYPFFPLRWHEGAALALVFSPGGQSALYRARTLALRGWWLIKRGEWRRVACAARKRLPQFGMFVRQKMRTALGC